MVVEQKHILHPSFVIFIVHHTIKMNFLKTNHELGISWVSRKYNARLKG